jgi:hypothetical protein
MSEQMCREHGDMLSSQGNKLDKLERKYTNMEIKLTKVDMTVDHIKERIDNGMSATITKIWDKMNEEIMPAVQDSKFWVGFVKKITIAMGIAIFAGGIIGTLFYLARKGITG